MLHEHSLVNILYTEFSFGFVNQVKKKVGFLKEMTVFQQQIIYLCNLALIYFKAHTPDKRICP